MISIRKALPTDISKVKEVLSKVNLSADIDSIDNFMVMELDNNIIATAGLEIYQDVAILRSVAVLPEFQHQGLGDGLVRAMINYADRRKISKLFLFTQTARGFFEKIGFKLIQRETIDERCKTSQQYKSNCPVNAYVMELNVKEFFNSIHC
ncbi:MAG TPA: GNAT family N-acetyltransferase [Thermoanaerobacterales bacterium]|nr:GNAT family N-acetyltransferase [Thermoanaerobacterales bacterium]